MPKTNMHTPLSVPHAIAKARIQQNNKDDFTQSNSIANNTPAKMMVMTPIARTDRTLLFLSIGLSSFSDMFVYVFLMFIRQELVTTYCI